MAAHHNAAHHNQERDVPSHADAHLFEMLLLEGAQEEGSKAVHREAPTENWTARNPCSRR
jgi:hypothetical protein